MTDISSIWWFVLALSYIGAGMLVGAFSVRVWNSGDSISWIARLLFPWHAHEHSVGGDVSGTICGEACREGPLVLSGYLVAMMLVWPFKLLLCLGVMIFLRFHRYQQH